MRERAALHGIHHITAITASASVNLTFYEQVLGLRLVKQTVNFDDPYTYHLYYGDDDGSPGTILTFFPWADLPHGSAGSGMVTTIAFTIPADSEQHWRQHLEQHKIAVDSEVRFGEPVLTFADPDGLRLELIAVTDRRSLRRQTVQPPSDDHAIRGFHSATALVRERAGIHDLLTRLLGLRLVNQGDRRYRYAMENDRLLARFYDVIVDPDAPHGRQGHGTVHHIAFRSNDDTEQLRWQEILRAEGIQVTAVRDRTYFKSIYFHEPSGVLFEIATDPPGFTVDESPDELGTSLQLPSRLEPQRAVIADRLPPLRPTDFIHRFVKEESSEHHESTIVALHGTGGDEHDLVPLAGAIGNGSAIISPRGRVREGALNRFFRRLAEGIFDERDLINQTHALADFLQQAAARYRRDPQHLVALGYSNGATIAAATLLLRPEVFAKAILLRPMLPLPPPAPVRLGGTSVLVLRGSTDTVIPAASTDELIKTLREAGATVTVQEIATGHGLTREDMEAARNWLAATTSEAPVH